MTVTRIPTTAAPRAPAEVPLVDTLLTTAARAELVDRVMNVARSLGSREDRRLFWEKMTAEAKFKMHREGAAPDRIAPGLQALARDVKAESEKRDKISVAASRDFNWKSSVQNLAAESERVVIRFPGDSKPDQLDALFARHGPGS